MSRRGSNLFQVDLDSIPSVLTEANAGLVEELRRALVETAGLLEGGEDPTPSELRLEYQKVKDLKKRFADARLSDGRPFSDAVKTVKAWFERYERELEAVLSRIQTRLDRFVRRYHESAEQLAESGVSSGSLAKPLFEDNPGEAASELPAIWVVESFDRRSLDLEALRPYLTDHSIEMALRKHLKDTGSPCVAGCKYRRSAKL